MTLCNYQFVVLPSGAFVWSTSQHQKDRATLGFPWLVFSLYEAVPCVSPHTAPALSLLPPLPIASINPQEGEDELDCMDSLSREALIIHKSQLSNMKAIGKGQYGLVYYGKLRYSPDSHPIEVVVKLTKVCVHVCVGVCVWVGVRARIRVCVCGIFLCLFFHHISFSVCLRH